MPLVWYFYHVGYHREDSILYDQISITRATEVLWDLRVERSPRFIGIYFYKLRVLLGSKITNEIHFTNLYLLSYMEKFEDKKEQCYS